MPIHKGPAATGTEIPSVAFLKKSSPGLEFECLRLSTLFARQERDDQGLDRPHRVNFFHILFVTRGEGRHYIDFQQHDYRQGGVLIIARGQVHAYEVKPGNEGILLLFTEDFLTKSMIHSDILAFCRLGSYDLESPILSPEDLEGHDVRRIFEEIASEYKAPADFAKEEILRSLLKLLLLRIERIKQSLRSRHQNSAWFLQFGMFRNHLEKGYTKTRNARDYADLMHISYKHLNEICLAMTGLTAKRFIDRYIILELKRHLAMSDISTKELTYTLGFDEPTNLVKYFKKHTGLSPARFKQHLIK